MLPRIWCSIKHTKFSQQVPEAGDCTIDHQEARMCLVQMEALKARRLELLRRQPSEHDQERKQMPNPPLVTHQHATAKKAAVQARRAKVTREQATCP